MTSRARGQHRPNRIHLIAAALIGTLLLAGCASAPAADENPEPQSHISQGDLLVEQNLEEMTAAQIVDHLDTMPLAERPQNFFASVRPNELVLSDGQSRETRLPMPEDLVYISVAPYASFTHDCHFHSLTTCVGELSNTEVQVVLTHDATGEVLLDETRTTFDNGFIGMWVPRGIRATLTVDYGELTGTTEISTQNDDDPTCITTLHVE